jgi:hypothetical protein
MFKGHFKPLFRLHFPRFVDHGLAWVAFSAAEHRRAPMWKIMTAAIGLLVVPAAAAAQSKAEMTVGFLDHSGGTIRQALSVRNNGLRPIKAVTIACRFFRYAKLLGSGSIGLENIGPDTAGYTTMLVASQTPPNRATCDIASVKR